MNSKLSDKCHYEELIAFVQAIKKSTNYPIPLWQIEQATKISFAVKEEIKKRRKKWGYEKFNKKSTFMD